MTLQANTHILASFLLICWQVHISSFFPKEHCVNVMPFPSKFSGNFSHLARHISKADYLTGENLKLRLRPQEIGNEFRPFSPCWFSDCSTSCSQEAWQDLCHVVFVCFEKQANYRGVLQMQDIDWGQLQLIVVKWRKNRIH